jgi:TolB-like protein/class 3 adenylate cyclase/tetratricopeptide (TPR) repeat protein
MTEQRRLAAILVADVAGYSKFMGSDEAKTLAQLEVLRTEIIGPQIAKHAGRLFKSVGDGFLIEFASAVQAVNCAKAIQDANGQGWLLLRIGIHVGDVVVQDDDLMGDGVNVAARVEGIAEPGGIAITRAVHEQVRDKLDIGFVDKGEIELKNIRRPVQVFVIGGTQVDSKTIQLPLPDKPSIAVLPFQNMSGDPEQEYFADGMVDDITTALSRFKSLFVIARNSSFSYKGKSPDIRQVGRALGVRYVLEGSVRKAGGKVRITGQLIDSATGAHLWAHRFEGSLEDIFELQDKVTTSVVGAVAPKLDQAEIERAKRKPTESLDAYDYYLRGVADLQIVTKLSNETALQLFYKAIDIDPNFASAIAMGARCYTLRKVNRWMTDPVQESAEAVRLARRAIEVGKDDAVALCYAGYALVHAVYELEGGAAFIERAIALNPHLAIAWQLSGTVQAFLGHPEVAIEHTTRAMRLSPLDPSLSLMQSSLALAYFIAGRYDDASKWAGRAIQEGTTFLPHFRMAIASNALAGRQEEARDALRRMLKIDPTARISNAAERALFRRPQDVARLEEGLRIAGLPE